MYAVWLARKAVNRNMIFLCDLETESSTMNDFFLLSANDWLFHYGSEMFAFELKMCRYIYGTANIVFIIQFEHANWKTQNWIVEIPNQHMFY